MKIAQILPPGDPSRIDAGTIIAMLPRIIQLSLTVVGGLAVIYLLIGAFDYFTAFGDSGKADNAKKTITWAIYGVILIIVAKVIISEVWQFITGTPIDFLI